MGPIKTLIHLHTDYSFDSNISLDTLADSARREGIGCIAVTDHDTIEGAKRLQGISDLRIIVGEEITTRDGHLIGLFLDEHIRPGMSTRETALAIRRQGGLVFLPHPFVSAFGCGLGDACWDIVDLIDAVEVCNGQNLSTKADRRAAQFAETFGLTKYVGADSHMAGSIVPCCQFMDSFETPTEFLASLRNAELKPGRHPLWYFAATAYRVARSMAGLSLPHGFGVNMPAIEREPACGGAVRGMAINTNPF